MRKLDGRLRFFLRLLIAGLVRGLLATLGIIRRFRLCLLARGRFRFGKGDRRRRIVGRQRNLDRSGTGQRNQAGPRLSRIVQRRLFVFAIATRRRRQGIQFHQDFPRPAGTVHERQSAVRHAIGVRPQTHAIGRRRGLLDGTPERENRQIDHVGRSQAEIHPRSGGLIAEDGFELHVRPEIALPFRPRLKLERLRRFPVQRHGNLPARPKLLIILGIDDLQQIAVELRRNLGRRRSGCGILQQDRER